MTRAFMKSVKWWQRAMMAATPIALFSEVDLEEAAFTRAGAAAWEEFLARVETSCSALVREAEAEDGAESVRVANGRAVVSSVGFARRHAQEHLRSFDPGPEVT